MILHNRIYEEYISILLFERALVKYHKRCLHVLLQDQLIVHPNIINIISINQNQTSRNIMNANSGCHKKYTKIKLVQAEIKENKSQSCIFNS